MGNDKKPLKQTVDRGDLVALLINLGYSNISELGFTRARWGSLGSLEEIITGWTVGVPSTALVSIRVIGRTSNNVLVTFTY